MEQKDDLFRKTKLGEIAKEIRETVKNPVEKGIDRVVGLEHLDSQELKISRWGSVTDGTTFTKKFKAGQILFGRRRAYQKKAALADFDGICSGDITVIEAIPGNVVPDLLPYIVQNDTFFEYAVSESAGSLSPRAKWKHLAEYEVYLPSIEKQGDLAALVKAYDESIESKRIIIKHLKNMTQAYINALCEKCKIEDGWAFKPLTKAVAINNETLKESTPSDYEIQYIDIESVTTGSIHQPQRMVFSKAPSRARRVVKSKDLLISTVRPYLKAFAIVNDSSENLIASTGFAVLTPKLENISEYLFAFAISDAFYNQIQDKMVGTSYPAITANDLKKVVLPMPKSIDEIDKATSILSAIFSNINSCELLIDKLQSMKKMHISEKLNLGGGRE